MQQQRLCMYRSADRLLGYVTLQQPSSSVQYVEKADISCRCQPSSMPGVPAWDLQRPMQGATRHAAAVDVITEAPLGTCRTSLAAASSLCTVFWLAASQRSCCFVALFLLSRRDLRPSISTCFSSILHD